MCKFKVGDRAIRNKESARGLKKGEVYLVVSVSRDGWIMLAGFEDSLYFDFNHFSLDPSKRRPHYDLIIAWANGAEIQWFNTEIGEWQDMKTLSWAEHHQYRIKPNPKDEALEAAKKAFEQAEEAYKKAAEALAKAGG